MKTQTVIFLSAALPLVACTASTSVPTVDGLSEIYPDANCSVSREEFIDRFSVLSCQQGDEEQWLTAVLTLLPDASRDSAAEWVDEWHYTGDGVIAPVCDLDVEEVRSGWEYVIGDEWLTFGPVANADELADKYGGETFSFDELCDVRPNPFD